ncbi:MAG: glycoside hydrolase family 3 C-terminal domain-containing protein [Bacteroidales bacterium]|nr:glycoside hydrolase family 3 C-terminal domain-containing protein [Bacteroidales bacterium]
MSFEERAADLVSRMTLEEKVSQMSHESKAIDRLGVPEYNWWNECLHGVARAGHATVFPQAIGMAAMWNEDMIYRIATAVSDEARAKHHNFLRQGKRGIYQGLTYWTPNINIFRDPRWGRGMETYGEDPYLTGELGVGFIKGLQGDDPKYLKLVATAKHFAVHSGPESTRHSANVNPSLRDFYETYTPHFKKAVQEAGVWSVMGAYQRLWGEPCCGSYFLGSLLREKWGFRGYIVSDCWAIKDFYDKGMHEIVETPEQAAAQAVKSGTDLNCGVTFPYLTESVRQGLITEGAIDTAVQRLMLARFKLGMFDNPKHVPYSKIPMDVVESEQHVALALEAARESMVLLENNGILPFSKEVKNVAVIGPNADDTEVLLGNYNGYSRNPVTPLRGIMEKLSGARVIYAQGCALAGGLPYFTAVPSRVLFTDSSMSRNGLSAKYYNNPEWAGDPVHSRVDSLVDFVWWNEAPFAGMDPAHFSVEWTGVICVSESGNYALGAESFPGFSLVFDGKELISRNQDHHPGKVYEFVYLQAGKSYPLSLRYYQKETEYAIMRLLWDAPGRQLKQEAIQVASASDLVILCMGLSPSLEGEEMKVRVKGFKDGDREDIQLPASQVELIKAIARLNKPTVLVLLNGSAVSFDNEIKSLPAILEAWYPGQEGGTAIADIIFGDYNPGGKLPITFYRSIDQIPAFDNYDMQGKTYRFFRDTPLYPFGYGLSYTQFSYRITELPESVPCGIPVDLTVEITNTGHMEGDEVVQLYVTLPDASFPVPVKSLQGFKRIHLKPGESQLVRFTLVPEQMASLDDNQVWVVEPGEVLIETGGTVQSVRLVGDNVFIPN